MKNRSYFPTIYGLCMRLVLAITSTTAADAEKNANPYKGPEFRHLHRLGANGIEAGFLDRDGHLYALYEYPYRGSQHVVR